MYFRLISALAQSFSPADFSQAWGKHEAAHFLWSREMNLNVVWSSSNCLLKAKKSDR